MSGNTKNEMNISAVLDAFTYLELKDDYNEKTRGEIMTNVPCGREWSCGEAVWTAVQSNPQLAGMKLVNQSRLYSDIPDTYITACTFVSADGKDYYIAYRGTGDGQWLDDAEGLYQVSTEMQRAASNYFDKVATEFGLSEKNNVIVTGHSKGGNEAQFVTMDAEKSYLIDSCYSYDGQGFSAEAIAYFREKWGDTEYQARISRMYSINAQNDFVHGLGIGIIPKDGEHTLFLAVPDGVGIGGQHALENLLIGGRLDLDHPVEEGPIAKFANRLSEEIMALGREDIRDCTLAIMSLIEGADGDFREGAGELKFASLEEFCGFISVGIPTILKTALLTEEGHALLGMLAMEGIKGIASSEGGVLKLIALTELVIVCAPAIISVGSMLAPFILETGAAIWGAATLLDVVLGVFDDDFEISDIFGVAIMAGAIMKAAAFLLANPEIVAVLLALAAAVTFISFVISHWDDITAFVKAAGDFIAGVAVTIFTWAENLVQSGIELLKAAIGAAVKICREAAQAILDFGNMLLSAAVDFFSSMAQAVMGLLGGIASWIKSIFGNGSAALAYGSQITVTISYLEDLQYRIGDLRGDYLALSGSVRDADGVISRVNSYYKESYVRSCCRNAQSELKNAQKYINSIEKDLDRKRKALTAAVDGYRRSDWDAASQIHRFFN